MNTRLVLLCVVLVVLASATAADAARRFEIKVVDGRLVAHGYSSSGDDGGGAIRPFYNAIHDHWFDIDNGSFGANLPSFDIATPGVLAGHSVWITLTGASKWVTPGAGVPNVVPIDSEVMTVTAGGATVSTDEPGTVTLVGNVSAGGDSDLEVFYTIDDQPSGIVHVVEMVLSTDAPGVADSGTVYAIIAPGLHGPSLELEAFLGAPLCPGDFNGDGEVHADDLATLLAAWGNSGVTDLDSDGTTGPSDLAILLAGWGAC